MDHRIKPVKQLKGTITVPGDKSISHRALMLGSLAHGETSVENLSPCEDVQSTLKIMRQLGVEIVKDDNIVHIPGQGPEGLKAPEQVLDVGNAGTCIRLLSGILAGQKFNSIITGDHSIQKRPMKRIIKPLREMNASITGKDDQFAPLHIRGTPLKSHTHQLSIASAQVKSCLLFAGMYAEGMTTVIEPVKSRDHTERMLTHLNAQLEISGTSVSIHSNPELTGKKIIIPGDISAAAFFMVAASLVNNSNLVINNVGFNPTRTGIIDILKMMTGSVKIKNQQLFNNEEIADIQVQPASLQGIEIDKTILPRIIDEIPILAIAATRAKGSTIIKDAAELRVKETDRIQAVVQNLRRMGANVTEQPDGMIIQGEQKLAGAEIESYGDHRIAMAFSIAGLIAEGETIIKNSECVNVSHPGFSIN